MRKGSKGRTGCAQQRSVLYRLVSRLHTPIPHTLPLSHLSHFSPSSCIAGAQGCSEAYAAQEQCLKGQATAELFTEDGAGVLADSAVGLRGKKGHTREAAR